MRQLNRDWDVPSTLASHALRLRQEIDTLRRRLLELDHPETIRVFEMLMNDAQSQLDKIERRSPSI